MLHSHSKILLLLLSITKTRIRMKKQISCLLILLMTGILSATPIQGLQIESLNERVVVYLDGQQVSAPTFSCFIANLSYGTYRLEIFSAKDDYWRKNNCLYDSFISYRGGVEEVVIDVDNRYNNRHQIGRAHV